METRVAKKGNNKFWLLRTKERNEMSNIKDICCEECKHWKKCFDSESGYKICVNEDSSSYGNATNSTDKCRNAQERDK